jgi:dTDP-4-amino-4,6-dideoxygalactose transaminase
VGLLPVHLFGRLADVDAVAAIAERHGLWVLEDAACAFGATRAGRHAGTFGVAGCFSFHPRKSLTTGEGGMVLTADAELAARARTLRNHGGSRSDLERHSAPRSFELADYEELGFNYRMTDFQGALGCAQLDRADWLLAERRRLAARYTEALTGVQALRTPDVPAGETHGWQSYVCRFEGDDRDALMQTLEDQGIATRVGTLALHRTGTYRRPDAEFPGATICEQRSIALPLFPGLLDAEQDRVIDALRA